MARVIGDAAEKIAEHGDCFLEGDLVLRAIDRRLQRIPLNFKPIRQLSDHHRNSSIHTHAKVRKSSAVTAGMREAFNQASLDRVDPSADHNNGNRFCRSLDHRDQPSPCRYHDINFETYQLGREITEPLSSLPTSFLRLSRTR